MESNYKNLLELNLHKKIINKIKKKGKKNKALSIFKNILNNMHNEFPNENSFEKIENSLNNIKPNFKIKMRKRYKKIVEIPVPIRSNNESKQIAINWILENARKNNKESFKKTINSEFFQAAMNEGLGKNKQELITQSVILNKRVMFTNLINKK